MGLHQYSDDHEKNLYYSFVPKKYPCYQDYHHEVDDRDDYPCKQKHHEEPKEDYEEKDFGCEKDFCDSESARALKKILSMIDELNYHDLKTLDEVVERLLCSRGHAKEDYPL